MGDIMENKLKITICICVLLIITVSTMGCGGSNDEVKEEAGKNLEITPGKMIYTDYILSESDFCSTPPSGYKFFIMDVKVTNNDNSVISVNPNFFTMEDSSTQTYTYDWESHSLPDGMTHTDIAAGSSYTSKLVFEIPNSASPSKLIFDNYQQKKEITISSNEITIRNNKPPMVLAGGDQSVYLGDDVSFDGTNSVDPEGKSLDYEWDFGDGEVDKYSNGITTHRYEDVSAYTVTLKVIDICGLFTIDTLKITIFNTPPIAKAGSDQKVYLGDNVDFDGHCQQIRMAAH